MKIYEFHSTEEANKFLESIDLHYSATKVWYPTILHTKYMLNKKDKPVIFIYTNEFQGYKEEFKKTN